MTTAEKIVTVLDAMAGRATEDTPEWVLGMANEAKEEYEALKGRHSFGEASFKVRVKVVQRLMSEQGWGE